MGEVIVFYSLAALISVCSVLVITLKNPVTAAVSLVMTLFLLAGVYALQGADFIAAIQIIVYAGAILVLFMFVIMLLNLDPEELKEKSSSSFLQWFTVLGVLAALGVFSLKAIMSSDLSSLSTYPPPPDADNTMTVAMHLFTRYLWPFELASVLILLAIVASVVIAKKKKMSATHQDGIKGADHGAR